ncbi:MAG TPA: Eco29kI family restriction endonuclease [bacterium]|nr:Eco29kI family restriction endonuclease [bacterium]
MNEKPYNPLDKANLGKSLKEALFERGVTNLPPGSSFEGAGIYAIYYIGPLGYYSRIADRNADDRWGLPIYVGKAIPPGSRRGILRLDEPPGNALYNRLREHGESINQAENLDLSDFRCRYLIADDIWIPLGETLVITSTRPVWNLYLDGFGLHDPGGGRRKQQRSLWDTVHPGRRWAARQAPNNLSIEEILAALGNFIDDNY